MNAEKLRPWPYMHCFSYTSPGNLYKLAYIIKKFRGCWLWVSAFVFLNFLNILICLCSTVENDHLLQFLKGIKTCTIVCHQVVQQRTFSWRRTSLNFLMSHHWTCLKSLGHSGQCEHVFQGSVNNEWHPAASQVFHRLTGSRVHTYVTVNWKINEQPKSANWLRENVLQYNRIRDLNTQHLTTLADLFWSSIWTK